MAQSTNPNTARTEPGRREVFVLRLWHEADDSAGWRGQLQHVHSGRTIAIQDPESLIEAIESYMEQPETPPERASGLR